MTPGEPLEKSKDAEGDHTDPILLGPLARGRDREDVLSDTADLLSQTFEGMEPEDDDADDMTSLDEEVRSLMNTIAEEESEHDEAWVEASRREIEDDFVLPDPEDRVPVQAGPMASARSEPEEPAAMDEPDDAHDPEPRGGIDTDASDAPAEDAPAARATDIDRDVDGKPSQADTITAMAAPETSKSRAIDVLSERFAAAEERNGQAMDRIGHALGMIATRIDGLEARATDRTIADVAFVAAPPEEDDDEDDASVAPYIARAEKELKAKKESGSMDIFDRIARAAENKFDDEIAGSETRIVADASDGRRVGTKRWQPSKAVKKRMALLEKTRAESAGDAEQAIERPLPASRKLRVENEDMPTKRAGKIDEQETPAPEAAIEPELDAKAAPEPDFEPQDEDDDAGLSVLPGARGRRRNRARKSALDSDFENVFAEEGDKPSIQSLRRKMRERPVEAPEPEEKPKGGMLGGILGRKSAKKTDPVVDAEGDDEDLMAAFDPSDEAPKVDAPAKPAKPAKAAKKAKAIDPDMDDEDDDPDEDWEDDGAQAISGSRRKLLVYALIAFAAAAGFAVWKMFLA